MVTSMGIGTNPGLGMFGGGQVPPPWASMPPQGSGGIDPTNAMSQLGRGTPQAPTGAWAENPSSAPPWFQAAMQSPGGVQGWFAQQRAQQPGAGQGMDPRLLAMHAGILSGMGGQMPWGPQQPPRGMPPPPMPRQPVRPPQQASRRAVYGGGSAGNISLSGY
jgi:hypothetical protein